jgi:hypothetical protein
VDETLVNIACVNPEKFVSVNDVSTPIEIVHLDVTAFDPKQGSIFYMFNPFGGATMQHILDNIRASLITHPRDIRVLYNNSKHRAVLDMQDWLTPEGVIENSRVYMWRNSPVLESL